MYLRTSCTIDIKFKPDPTKGCEDFLDADFSGLWNNIETPTDPSTANSRARWIMYYARCPIIWASHLMTQVALSTTEAE